VDVYSFGLVLYEILTESAVFPGSLRPFEVIKKIRKQEYPPVPTEFGPLMQSLIRQCWSPKPNNRPSFEQIFNKFQSMNFSILPGANDILVHKYVSDVLEWETTNQS
jgi:hypothetical protein